MNNRKRLSWGVVAYLRHKFEQRAQQDRASAYCDLQDLVFFRFPGDQVEHNAEYEQGDMNSNISTRFIPEDL